MINNPSAKQILIYGDSLVYGKKPSVPERFDSATRFTGIIQELLGNNFNIIEEGLRARMLVGENVFFPERNGLEQFGPIFGSHVPLDLVVIMLGTNDGNSGQHRTAEEYASTLGSYLEKISTWCTNLGIPTTPKVLLVAPPHMQASEIAQDTALTKIFGEAAEQKSKELAPIYEQFARENNIAFFDASTVCKSASGEGVHLDIENNKLLGEALARKIQEQI
ncbi:MAG TPA: GDSL-type esterase/lipase family protein [Candidatus Paceibacterota bacterium]